MPDLHELIKKMAVKAVEESKPMSVLFGTVVQEEPIQIKVDSKFILEEDFLLISEYLTDREIEIETEEERKTVKFFNKLKEGERVILFQEQGGQRFYVVDRLKKEDE